MKKNIKKVLFISILVLSLLSGCSFSNEEKNTKNIDSNDKEVNNNQESSNNQKEKNNQKVNNSNNSNSEKSTEKDAYLGHWYEKKDSLKDYTPSELYIKSKNDKELVLNLYISRIGNFDNVKVNLADNSFEAISENALSNDGEKAKITGKVVLDENEITFNILTSNLADYNNNTISFKYKMKDVNISAYKGIWYESEELSKGKNPTSITIKNVTGNNLTFDLYICRTANVDDVKVDTNVSTFRANSYNGVSNDDNDAYIDGFIRLVDDEIILVIRYSNVQGIENNTVYTFKYKEYNNK